MTMYLGPASQDILVWLTKPCYHVMLPKVEAFAGDGKFSKALEQSGYAGVKMDASGLDHFNCPAVV